MTAEVWVNQIDEVLKAYVRFESDSAYDDLSDLDEGTPMREFVTRASALIARICGPSSVYATQASEKQDHLGLTAVHLASVLRALRTDIQMGYLESLVELLHADLFADYLEMASHLLENNYKDAAAVIAGSTLEGHLRQLASKNGVSLVVSTPSGDKAKKADTINGELSKAGAYGKLENKSVTAWLDLRNSAAHGEYTKYTAAEVSLLIAGVRAFVGKYPA